MNINDTDVHNIVAVTKSAVVNASSTILEQNNKEEDGTNKNQRIDSSSKNDDASVPQELWLHYLSNQHFVVNPKGHWITDLKNGVPRLIPSSGQDVHIKSFGSTLDDFT